MKKSFKIISAVLAAFISVSAFAVFPAYAAQLKSGKTPAGYISEYRDVYEQYGEAVEAIADGLYDVKDEIDIYKFRIPYENDDTSIIELLFCMADRMHPELFYVNRNYQIGIASYGGKLYFSGIYPQYTDTLGNTLSKTDIDTMKTEFFSRAQWYLDKVDDSMSDFEKALILHDELALNSSYLLSGETYDLMVNGLGKCYGYSEAYSYLLAQVGVKTEIVESDDMNHQWNKVNIDGEYYHVDVTWDDPVNDKPGKVEHTYFLLSDSAIEGLAHPHYGYATDYPSNDTHFDSMKFHGIDTQFCYVGNDSYVVDNGSKNVTVYSLENDSLTGVYSFANEYWPAENGYLWAGGFSGLQEKYGWLYFNSATAVYTYDTKNGTVEKFSSAQFEKNVYGVRVIGNKLYAVLADNPNVTGTLEFVDYCLTRLTRGDADGDDRINVNDVTELQKYLSGMAEPGDDELAAADVNRDGVADISDVTALQRIIAQFDE